MKNKFEWQGKAKAVICGSVNFYGDECFLGTVFWRGVLGILEPTSLLVSVDQPWQELEHYRVHRKLAQVLFELLAVVQFLDQNL